MTLEYPENSLQYTLAPEPWWIDTGTQEIDRGRLVRTFIPHVDQEPRTLIPEGRSDPEAHGSAVFRIEPLRIGTGPRRTKLPVAALPEFPGEVHVVLRAKVRPAIVVSLGGHDVARGLRTGGVRYQTNRTILVAPYYGADRSGMRGGWKPEFVERIQRCEYPQYMWDRLPVGGVDDSILRLDHLQPVGLSANGIIPTKFRLGDQAMLVFDEWLQWLITGALYEESVLFDVREHLLSA